MPAKRHQRIAPSNPNGVTSQALKDAWFSQHTGQVGPEPDKTMGLRCFLIWYDVDVKHTFSAGGVILNSDNDVLVVSQHGTSWSLPKGKLEEGEDDKAAALREIEEETGITDVKLIKRLGVYDRFRIGKDGREEKEEFKTITMFLYTTSETNLAPIDPDNPEARWLHPDNVEAQLSHPKDKAFYASVLDEVKAYIASKQTV